MNEVEYVNGFSCAMDESGAETIIVLRRGVPVINEAGDFVNVDEEVVGTLVMTTNAANELYEALGDILGRTNEPLY
ncbi:MAG: hypothetical protein J6P61_07280 [Erysipelotrichaceae bacterium]|nr:hypothetical protein [Erysipelotrichaceae bacterium]